MDQGPTIKVEGVKLTSVNLPEAPGEKWFSAEVMVQSNGPQQGLHIFGVLIPDNGDDRHKRRVAIVEAQRLARLFSQDTRLATDAE